MGRQKKNLGCIVLVCSLFVLFHSAESQARKRSVQPGYLMIFSMTEEVKIYVDGRLIGKTPIPKKIPFLPGKHLLKATKAGYSTIEMDFTIRSGRKTELQVDLLPHSGLVKFGCNVKGSEVYVDNKLIGLTPLILEILVGDHSVQIVKEGYNDFITQINVKAGEKLFVEGTLSPFQDFSADVLAIAQKQKEEQTQEFLPDSNAPSIESSPSWYTDLHKKWWFWTVTGAIVITAITVPLVVTAEEQSGINDHDAAWKSQLP